MGGSGGGGSSTPTPSYTYTPTDATQKATAQPLPAGVIASTGAAAQGSADASKLGTVLGQ